MANLTRYAIVSTALKHGMKQCFEKCAEGEYVKFDDIKEFLPSASNNSRYATALHDIGRVIDGDYGDMTMTQSFEQIRTIVQGFNTASERYCA